MLYITLKGSSKRLYINLKALSTITVAAMLLWGMFYVSNQEYLALIK